MASCKCDLWCLTCFPSCNDFGVTQAVPVWVLHSILWLNKILLSGETTFHFSNRLCWTFGSFSLGALTNTATANTYATVFVWPCFNLSRSGIVRSYGNSTLYLLLNHYNVLESGVWRLFVHFGNFSASISLDIASVLCLLFGDKARVTVVLASYVRLYLKYCNTSSHAFAVRSPVSSNSYFKIHVSFTLYSSFQSLIHLSWPQSEVSRGCSRLLPFLHSRPRHQITNTLYLLPNCIYLPLALYHLGGPFPRPPSSLSRRAAAPYCGHRAPV